MDNLQTKFLQEATELIDDLEKAVLQLENDPSDHAQREEVFRVMHTFKGTAKMFGFDKIGEFTHHLENVFDDLRYDRIVLTEKILDLTLRSVDHIRRLLISSEQSFLEEHAQVMEEVRAIISDEQDNKESHTSIADPDEKQLYLIRFSPFANFLKDGNNPMYLVDDLSALGTMFCITHRDALPDRTQFVPDVTYLSWTILLYTAFEIKSIRNEFMFVEDRCELSVDCIGDEDLLADQNFIAFAKRHDGRLSKDTILKFTKKQPSQKISSEHQVTRHTLQSIKVTYDKIDKLMSIVSELVTTQARLSVFADGTKDPELAEISENVEKLVRQLRDETFSISLLPISHLSMRFERLVRDTSKALHKKIRFITVGGDTELDKKIIENLMDPLLHVLRNSMDHGIELPEERSKRGKDETGTIQLKAYYAGTNVMIEVRDDGAGINKERVLQKAFEKGLVKAGDQLSDQDIYTLIFAPGFSTAAKVTDVSGRGVGMDVVSKAVKNLRGDVEVESQEGKGSTFRFRLPLSLSIIDGLLVKISDATYVMPLTAIDKCYELSRKSIKPDSNALVVLDGDQIPYISLREMFKCEESTQAHVNIIVARHENQRVAFEVDSIVDEYQAVIKPLGKSYKNQDFTSGATILGNGTVALVLDLTRLISKMSEN